MKNKLFGLLPFFIRKMFYKYSGKIGKRPNT